MNIVSFINNVSQKVLHDVLNFKKMIKKADS